MSLQVWLPLTQDLRNQGLASITSSGTPVFKNTGKIGNKSLDLNTRINFTCTALANVQTFSIAFWAKTNQDSNITGDWMDVLGFIDVSTGGSNGQLRWETCYTYGAPTRGVSAHDNATYATVQGPSGQASLKGNWNHFCITVDPLGSGRAVEYRDGVKIGDYAANGGHLTGNFWTGETNKVNGEIQDIRIYNHALTQTEVKELAKGLVLHYPLNRSGLGQENFYTGNGIGSLSNTSSVSNNGYESTFVLSAQGGVRASNLGFNGKTGPWTASFDIKSSVNTTITIDICDRGYSTATYGTSLTKDIWIHKSFIVTTATNQYNVSGNYNGFIDFNCGAAGTYNIKNLKVEEGIIETPWCPASSSTLGQGININSTTEYDCSGYCNNGNKGGSGTISYISDTPKYAVSTQLIGTTVDNTSNTKTGAAYITGPCSLSNITSLTVSWWAKIKQYGRGGIMDLTAVTSNYEEGTDYNTCPLSNWDTTFRLWDGTNAFNFFSYVLKDSTWHHYAITFTSGSGKFYRDGINVANSGTMGNTLTNFNGIRIGLGKAGGVYRQIKEDVSDIRIYATALSAEDVLELYHTAARIDNVGNTYVYQYIET